MKTALMVGGTANVLVGLLHVVMVFVGPEAYIYFGAGQEFADKAASGSPVPAVTTLILALVFVVFGLYAYSGAGLIRHLLLLKVGLWGIGVIYVLRGLGMIPQLWQYFGSGPALPFRDIVFSGVALVIGVLYLVGALSCRTQVVN